MISQVSLYYQQKFRNLLGKKIQFCREKAAENEAYLGDARAVLKASSAILAEITDPMNSYCTVALVIQHE